MAKIEFPQFLRRYGIKMLVTSTQDIIPGAIIERRKRGYFKFGHLREVLDGDAESWRVELQPANFVYGSVERTLSLVGSSRLDQFGIVIGGGLSRAKSVRFDLQNVQARVLVNRSKLGNGTISALRSWNRPHRKM